MTTKPLKDSISDVGRSEINVGRCEVSTGANYSLNSRGGPSLGLGRIPKASTFAHFSKAVASTDAGLQLLDMFVDDDRDQLDATIRTLRFTAALSKISDFLEPLSSVSQGHTASFSSKYGKAANTSTWDSFGRVIDDDVLEVQKQRSEEVNEKESCVTSKTMESVECLECDTEMNEISENGEGVAVSAKQPLASQYLETLSSIELDWSKDLGSNAINSKTIEKLYERGGKIWRGWKKEEREISDADRALPQSKAVAKLGFIVKQVFCRMANISGAGEDVMTNGVHSEGASVERTRTAEAASRIKVWRTRVKEFLQMFVD